jgi:hypothetical protein
MSYPLDLDEYSEDRLRKELNDREADRRKGLCDYCKRSPSDTACRFPDRHHAPIAAKPTADQPLLDEMWQRLVQETHSVQIYAYCTNGDEVSVSLSWNYGQGRRRLQSYESTLSAAVQGAYIRHRKRKESIE